MDIEQGERRREWVTQEKGEGRWEMGDGEGRQEKGDMIRKVRDGNHEEGATRGTHTTS